MAYVRAVAYEPAKSAFILAAWFSAISIVSHVYTLWGLWATAGSLVGLWYICGLAIHGVLRYALTTSRGVPVARNSSDIFAALMNAITHLGYYFVSKKILQAARSSPWPTKVQYFEPFLKACF